MLRRSSFTANPRTLIDAYGDFALDARAAGRADLALKLLEPLASRESGSARLWQHLALAFRDEQQSGAALEAIRKAARLAPTDSRIVNALATITLEAGLSAAELFEAARKLSPHDREVALSLAAAWVADGQPAEGAAVIMPLLAADPSWERGHTALATLRWTNFGPDGFDASFAAAAARRPKDLALRLGWYRALAHARDWTAADKMIADGRKLFGPLIEFDAAGAHIATETGDDAGAEKLFARTSALNDPGTRISHIRHCLRTGRIEQAAAIADLAMQGPSPTSVWPYRSLIWRLTGDPRAAYLDGDPPLFRVQDLAFSDAELSALSQCLRAVHRARHHPAEQSLRGGTQTEGLLFARIDPEIVAVKAKILAAVRTYVDALPAPVAGHPLLGTPRGRLRFAGSWSVQLRAQGFHVTHTHPRGWISSALYIAVPSVEDFGTPPSGWLSLGAPPQDLRLNLPSYATIEPKAGRLVLFPSTMWHGTIPFTHGERLTIAFDVATPR